MTIARSVADVLASRVSLEVESVDRMYLNLYVPGLQYETGVVGFFRDHRGLPFASTALMGPMTRAFVGAVERFCSERGLDLLSFEKGARKDELAQQYLARFPGEEGVLFVGKAQRRRRPFVPRSAATLTPAPATRGWCGRRREPARFSVYRWVVRCCRGCGLRSGCVGLPSLSSSCNRCASSSSHA